MIIKTNYTELVKLNRNILNLKNIKKCSEGEEYRKDCDNYKIRSNDHEIYLLLVQKITLSLFDEKRC